MEIQKKQFVGDLNEYAFIQGSAEQKQQQAAQPQQVAAPQPVKARINPKFDWYQNAQFVFVSFKVEGGDKSLAKNAKVTFEKQCLLIQSEDQTINLQLSNEIDTEQSIISPFEKKLELKLKKVQEGVNWITLEPGQGGLVAQATTVPAQAPQQKARPYASQKNWDQIDRDIKKDLENEKPEGDAALNGLFK